MQEPQPGEVAPAMPPVPAGPALQVAAAVAVPNRGARGRWRRTVGDPRTWLWIYLAALALIAFWPAHVDEGTRPFLRLVTRVFPLLTYSRIEFAANIALFIPFGVLFALILSQRWLVLPLALVGTVTIESAQAIMGGARTPSIMDIIANLTGAAIGLLVVALFEWLRRDETMPSG